MIKLLLLTAILSGPIYPQIIAAPGKPGSRYTTNELNGIQLIVEPAFLGDSFKERAVSGKELRTLRLSIWIKNISNKEIVLITSEKIGFQNTNDIFMFVHYPDRINGSLLRLKPSELDLVALQPSEIVLMQIVQLSIPANEIKDKTLRVIYEIGDDAKKMYNAWSGAIEVDVKLVLR